MRRGTTPVICLTVQGYDLTGCKVYATLKQGNYTLTKTGNNLTITTMGGNTCVTFTLTQAETLELKRGSASVQIRWIDSNGIALATDIQEINVDIILLDGVITYA